MDAVDAASRVADDASARATHRSSIWRSLSKQVRRGTGKTDVLLRLKTRVSALLATENDPAGAMFRDSGILYEQKTSEPSTPVVFQVFSWPRFARSD